MFSSAKNFQKLDEEDFQQERRKRIDRRLSKDKTRFPFIDDDCKLVMKDRRDARRRASDAKLINNPLISSPLKKVNKLLKK